MSAKKQKRRDDDEDEVDDKDEEEDDDTDEGEDKDNEVVAVPKVSVPVFREVRTRSTMKKVTLSAGRSTRRGEYGKRF